MSGARWEAFNALKTGDTFRKLYVRGNGTPVLSLVTVTNAGVDPKGIKWVEVADKDNVRTMLDEFDLDNYVMEF